MLRLRGIFTLITLLLLTACANLTAKQTPPTPTLVRLSDEVLAQLTAEAATATAHPLPTITTPTIEVVMVTPQPTATSVKPLEATLTLAITPITVTAAVTTQVKVEVVIGAINLRSGPGIDYPTQGSAVQGQQFEVLGTDSTRFWLNIRTPKGQAWLSGKADYSRLLSGSLADLPIIQATAPLTPAQKTSLVEPTAIAPTGLTGQLIFMNHSGGELYRINWDGTGLTKLAGLEPKVNTLYGGVIDPVVSPNGQQVAFTRWDGAEFGAVYVAQVDGSGEELIMGDIRQPKSPTWSPDGTKLLISFQHGGRRDYAEECRTFDNDDGLQLPGNIKITKRHMGENGLTICFIRYDDLKWALRLIDLATKAYQDISTDTYSIAPTWNPRDPNQVIYQDERNLVALDLSQQKRAAFYANPSDTSPVFFS